MFPPHGTRGVSDGSGHYGGFGIDGKYPGYENLDAAAAQKMIQLINTHPTKIEKVYVCFWDEDSALNWDPFWRAIKDITLADGRRAKDVIRTDWDHYDHFHWVLKH